MVSGIRSEANYRNMSRVEISKPGDNVGEDKQNR